jgi:CheY-like chemotaxis protein
VKYTEKGSISFNIGFNRVDDDDSSIMLTVSIRDTGIGIKEEDLPKLFEAYQRIEEGRNRHIEGTGLGMNITIQLLALMNSKLEVESVYGKGSRFWFDIRQKVINAEPLGDFENSLLNPGEVYAYEGGFEAPDAKILVVDDNEMNLKVFKSLLKITKIQVTTATGGREAIELASKEIYNIIFTDHMMPDMDGIETLHHLKELPNCKYVPIFVLTANAITGAREQYMEVGFDGFVSKPIVSEKLEQVIRENLPAEMIHPLSEEDEKARNAGTASSVPDDLPSVEGLDWSFAWLHLPDMELLRSSLKEFYEVLLLHADKLQGMYEKLPDAEAVDAYRIQVHAMKSTAATVGIVPLAGMAKILEFAAKDNNLDTIRYMHDIYIEEWRSYKDKLNGVFGLGEDEDMDKPEGDKTELLSMIETLSPAMEELDVDTADMIVEKMRGYRYNDIIDGLIKKLSAAVADLDIEFSQEIMEDIKKEVG